MGLHFIPDNLNLNFVSWRKISYLASIVIILAGLFSLIVKGGPNYGIDFAGGTIVQIRFDEPVSDETLKAALVGSELSGLVIQNFDDENRSYLLRVSTQEDDSANAVRGAVTEAMKTKLPGVAYEIQRLEMVGPKVGSDLRSKAVEALYFATLFIAVYISGRFEQRWFTALGLALILAGGMYLLDMLGTPKTLLVMAALIITIALCCWLKLAFALGAIVSTVHDVLATVGIFSLLNKEFDLTIIAALFTIIGYSLNDTIVVYDRIRENLRANRKGKLCDIINSSINQTLSRTVLTSGTTMFVVIALLILGGGIIYDFSLVLMIGIFVGTYSSVFIASPLLLPFERTIQQRMNEEQTAKERAEVNRRNVAQV